MKFEWKFAFFTLNLMTKLQERVELLAASFLELLKKVLINISIIRDG